MEYFIHRGYWKLGLPENSLDAFKAAFDHGFSIETDIWSTSEKPIIQIGHDVGNSLCLLEDLKLLSQKYPDSRIALNVKSDGMAAGIADLELNQERFFCFDMSTPEAVIYRRNGISVAPRLSEYENPLWASDIYWLDSFHDEWWIEGNIVVPENLCVVVSPELHKRDTKLAYSHLNQRNFYGLCLDDPKGFN